MSKLRLNIAIVLITFALAGLILLQLYWIKNALELREEQFRKDVFSSLHNAVRHVERREALKRMHKHQLGNQLLHQLMRAGKGAANYFQKDNDTLPVDGKNNLKVKELNADTASQDNNFFKINGSDLTFNFDFNDSTPFQWQMNDVINSMANDRSELFNDMIGELFSLQSYTPVEKRLTANYLDSLLKQELKSRGISARFEFAAMDVMNQPLIMRSRASNKFLPQLVNEGYKVPLFPGSMFQPPTLLSIYFPHQRGFLLSRMWFMLSISVVFIGIIIGAFYYTIRTILQQKKLSEIKNDFINNMTHELKTPISTISLACEMLSDKDVRATDGQRQNYIRMINDENKRLGTLVENVLQNAVIERGELKLRKDLLNVNDLIRDLIESFKIQVEKRGGIIHFHADAMEDLVNADRVHLSNVIYNLLDNANKYTTDTPVITIATACVQNSIIIRVSDNGMGISKENQKRIFEKLYRVPSGNLHDIKGFGLGLSYVKAIVEMHGGEVGVESSPGKGSTFKFLIPLYGKENQNSGS
ncbi:MAG: sensor histidine kinase [Flavobacteriales bacterium]